MSGMHKNGPRVSYSKKPFKYDFCNSSSSTLNGLDKHVLTMHSRDNEANLTEYANVKKDLMASNKAQEFGTQKSETLSKTNAWYN
jgi:hypothetical protein